LSNYLKDEIFKNNIDSFISSFNKQNNSNILFSDIMDIHKGCMVDSKKLKLITKLLEEFKNDSTINLIFDNTKELSFNINTGIISNTKNDVTRVIN
jgi:hypothetical protein